jgi:hypothetical protein
VESAADSRCRKKDEVHSAAAGGGRRRSGSGELRRVGELEGNEEEDNQLS